MPERGGAIRQGLARRPEALEFRNNISRVSTCAGFPGMQATGHTCTHCGSSKWADAFGALVRIDLVDQAAHVDGITRALGLAHTYPMHSSVIISAIVRLSPLHARGGSRVMLTRPLRTRAAPETDAPLAECSGPQEASRLDETPTSVFLPQALRHANRRLDHCAPRIASVLNEKTLARARRTRVGLGTGPPDCRGHGQEGLRAASMRQRATPPPKRQERERGGGGAEAPDALHVLVAPPRSSRSPAPLSGAESSVPSTWKNQS